MAPIPLKEGKIFNFLNRKRKKNKDPILDSNMNLYDITYFNQNLLLERRKAERFEYTFSLIMVDTKSFQVISDNDHQTQMPNIFKMTIKAICSVTRITDIISYYDHDKIIILLPDTTKVGAKIVVERIKTNVRDDILKKFPYNLSSDSLITKIFTYPDDGLYDLEKEFTPKQVSTINKNINLNKYKDMNSPLIQEKSVQTSQTRNFLSVWNRININGGILSIYNPLFFDLAIFDNIFLEISRIIKRLIDIIGAIFCLIPFSPLFLIITLGIKLTSRGPVLFRQKRVGCMGKLFYVLKFRSMKHNSSEKMHQDYIENLLNNSNKSQKEPDYVAGYKAQVDQRKTFIGKILRKTSLDELPQLFNVLRGDMSLVGPRPHPVYEVEKYKLWQYRRITMKPGITGLSKINVRCTPENYDEAMRFDLRYVENWSLLLDLKILLKTIPLVICGKGAH